MHGQDTLVVFVLATDFLLPRPLRYRGSGKRSGSSLNCQSVQSINLLSLLDGLVVVLRKC